MILDTPPLDPSRSEGRRLLQEELSKPRYAVEPSLWDRFREWLLGLLDTTGPGLPSWVFALVVVVVFGVLALAAALLLRPEARARRSATDRGVLDERGVDATAYRTRANDALRQGNWDTAVLDGYRAVVAAAVERTILDELPGRTAHEASLDLSHAFPDEGEALRAGADRFDAVRYGHGRASETEAREVLALDERLARARPRLAHSGAVR